VAAGKGREVGGPLLERRTELAVAFAGGAVTAVPVELV